MYLSHYKLKKKPFDISPDPDFLWLGEKHQEGLATLKYGILQNKGFLMISGDVGTGKTALIRAIEKEVQAQIIVITIPDPSLNLMDFYNVMASELNMGRSFDSKGAFLIEFKKLILKAASTPPAGADDHRRIPPAEQPAAGRNPPAVQHRSGRSGPDQHVFRRPAGVQGLGGQA